MIAMIEEDWGVGPWDCEPDKKTDTLVPEETKERSIGERIIDWFRGSNEE